MKEVEVKFPIISVDEARARLENAGFKKEKEFKELVSYYDTPGGKWKDNKTTIRTKVIDEKVIFTIKKRMEGEFKSAIEKEISVNTSISDFREILLMLDLVPDLEYAKTREHYLRDDGCVAELDYVEETGDHFIELETQSEEKMKPLINELGFGNLTPDLRSYPNIVREYRENK